MQYRLLTLLLAVTALCLALGLGANADKIPVGAVTTVMMPVGVALALLTAAWRRAQIPNKILLVVLFTVGWCYLMAYAEVVLATFRSSRHPEAHIADPFYASLVGLFAPPAIVLGMLLLRTWLWSWHERFDRE